MNSLLEVENLTKSYGRNRVIDNLYLSLSSGEIVIIRGANGSGKTTLLSIISSLVSSDSGRVKILGNDLKLNPTFVGLNWLLWLINLFYILNLQYERIWNFLPDYIHLKISTAKF